MKQTAEIYPPLSERELKNAEIAESAAMEGMVLLENRNEALPLTKGQKLALFGNGAVRTVRGGTGSGDPFNGGLSGGGAFDIDQSPRYHIHILPAMIKAGFRCNPRSCVPATILIKGTPAFPACEFSRGLVK